MPSFACLCLFSVNLGRLFKVSLILTNFRLKHFYSIHNNCSAKMHTKRVSLDGKSLVIRTRMMDPIKFGPDPDPTLRNGILYIHKIETRQKKCPSR